MNSNQTRGVTRNLWGRLKDAFGSLTGNKRTQVSGLVDRAAGRVQSEIGNVESEIDSGSSYNSRNRF